MPHNWYAFCPKCKERFLKRDMRPIFTAETRYHTPKVLCYLCENCFLEFLEKYDVGM